jgi:hypothetical protein
MDRTGAIGATGVRFQTGMIVSAMGVGSGADCGAGVIGADGRTGSTGAGREKLGWGLVIPFNPSTLIFVCWRGVCIVRRLNLDASILSSPDYKPMMLMSKPPRQRFWTEDCCMWYSYKLNG